MKLVLKEADSSEEGSIAPRMLQVTSKRESVTVAQQASSSAPFKEADPEAATENPEAQSSSSAPLEDKELEAVTVTPQVKHKELEAVTINPVAQKALSSTPFQVRGMDAETKPSVVEVSISIRSVEKERAKKHKVTISTRSQPKKCKKAKKSTKDVERRERYRISL